MFRYIYIKLSNLDNKFEIKNHVCGQKLQISVSNEGIDG